MRIRARLEVRVEKRGRDLLGPVAIPEQPRHVDGALWVEASHTLHVLPGHRLLRKPGGPKRFSVARVPDRAAGHTALELP